MFKVEYDKSTQTMTLSGNFDASKVDEVKTMLEKIDNSISVDMSNLAFISSAGIGVLVMAYRRLKEKDESVSLVNLNDHIKKVFKLSSLDKVFDIK